MADSADTPTRSGTARNAALRGIIGQYGAAAAVIALAFAARALLTPIVHGEAPYLFFLPAVLAAAAIGGFGPGLLATGLGLVCGSFFIPGFPSLSPDEIVNSAAFAAIG